MSSYLFQSFHYDDKGRKIYDMVNFPNEPISQKNEDSKLNKKELFHKVKSSSELSNLKPRSIEIESITKNIKVPVNPLKIKDEKDKDKDKEKEKIPTPYHCKTCECYLQDNQAYLDHLNGKRHNQLLLSLKRKSDIPLKTKSDINKNLEELEKIGEGFKQN